MPVVIVKMLEGRTLEQKKQLAADMTDAFVKIGVPAQAVYVVLDDVPRQNWAVGGQLMSERK